MRSLIALVAIVGSSAALQAQTKTAIDPGMSRDQVVAKLGQPLSARTHNGFTYLLYRNGCEKKCGMNDLVVLDSGKVVDAVFRSPAREYTGASSSPHMINEADAKKGAGAGAGAPLRIAPTPKKTPPDDNSPSLALLR